MKQFLRFSQRRPYWRVKSRSARLVEAVLLDNWQHREVRIYRWKFLADAMAYLYRRPVSGQVNETVVESYRPGENVRHLGTRLSQ